MPTRNKAKLSELEKVEENRKLIFSRYGQRPSFSLKERSIRLLLQLLTYLTIAITILIVIVLVKDAWYFFRQVNIFEFLFGTVWHPFGEPKKFGVLPLLAGTLMVAFGASFVAIPLGVGTAVFLTQYATIQIRETIIPIIEMLGGIPTVVYGYFALMAVTPFLRRYFPEIEVFNALSAAIVVGISIVPLISSLSAESMRLVPMSIQNAGYALGMRKFHVIVKVLIPGAASGIMASIILGFGRAIGETMAVTLAAGATPNMDFNYLKGIQTITGYIVQISLGDTPAGSLEYYTIYALGLVLFFITFSFNLLASKIVKRFREVYQ